MNPIRKITVAIMTVSVLSLLFLTVNQPSTSACTISLGKKIKFDMELSPKVPLFNPTKDGYFCPGSPIITKNIEVKNVGNIPFRIYRCSATFYGDTYLATGLQIKIVELGNGKGAKAHLLYIGRLSMLRTGIALSGRIEVAGQKSVTLQITLWMPKTAGNTYQGLNMTADIDITVLFSPAFHGGKY